MKNKQIILGSFLFLFLSQAYSLTTKEFLEDNSLKEEMMQKNRGVSEKIDYLLARYLAKNGLSSKIELKDILGDQSNLFENKIIFEQKTNAQGVSHQKCLAFSCNYTKKIINAINNNEHKKSCYLAKPIVFLKDFIDGILHGNKYQKKLNYLNNKIKSMEDVALSKSGSFRPYKVSIKEDKKIYKSYKDLCGFENMEKDDHDFLPTGGVKLDPIESFKDLDPQKVAAIRHYTWNGFKQINYTLNNKLRDFTDPKELLTEKELKEKLKNVEMALDTLPDYKGTVYRHHYWTTDEEKEMQSTGIVTVKHFASTSKQVGVAESFWTDANARQDLLVIKSKKGKDIQKYSSKPDEKEVLFQRGTQFRVIKKGKVKIEGSGLLDREYSTVCMEEV